jgi:peptide/nickel transport system permease protein
MRFTPRFWVASVMVVIIAAIGFIGPLLMTVTPDEVVGGLYDPPQCCGALLLGTDNEGQSVLANLVYGTRTSLLVGLVAGIIATVVGIFIGLLAGYRGGWLDDVLTAITNVFLVIPAIVVVILISIALENRSVVVIAVIIGIMSWPWVARAVRAQSSSVRNREHIDVAKLSGARFWSILAWDVLPYLLSYVVMAFVLQVSSAILFEATLSLLGLGPSGVTSLGIMLYWAIAWQSVQTGAWWAFLPPTVMLTLIAFSLLLLQSSLDEVFNPRLRRGRKAKKKAKQEGVELDEPLEAGESEHIGAAGLLETPVSAGTKPEREI